MLSRSAWCGRSRSAAKDPKLYRLLAVVDALRIGRARDREIAAAELRAWL
jgi:hypothetical protein